ncbi:MAG: Flagellar basal body P-ring biosynthesis protein-like protein [Verrucomicrobiales bacterium]|nr:Flagellar basal body P-ring biosynthesis protein-like protein [Verrucomicrobiales bacterium]
MGRLTLLMFLVVGASLAESVATTLNFNPVVEVDRSGVFLDQVLNSTKEDAVPHIRLGVAPIAGQTVTWTREKAADVIKQQASEYYSTNWTGASHIKITRKMKQLGENDLKELMIACIQEEYLKGNGTLETRFTKPWTPISVPDETITCRVLELPATGINYSMIVRIELLAGKETLGTWQVVTQNKVWREIPVAKSNIKRGQLYSTAEVQMEKRDVLLVRDSVIPSTEDNLEFTEAVQAGQPILNRSLKVKPLIKRGTIVEAIATDGVLNVSLKVEALEDGLYGQTIKVRNFQTRKEFNAKVQNEQSVQVPL